MKNHLLVILCVILIIPFSGCKKKSFDPSVKSRQDFIGTWKGSISTFKNNKLLLEYGTIVIYPDAANTTLSGILFMKETNTFHEFQFVGGTLYFKVDNSDPNSPLCQNWTLEGYAAFTAEGTIDIRISGNECGEHGNEYVNWSGSMLSAQVPADSLKSYSFAKAGNSWTYKITMKNGDSCQVQKQISQVSSSYLFAGPVTQTCGWIGQSRTFTWNVNPSSFAIVSDSTLSRKGFSFPVTARPGIVYYNFISNDTTTVTLLDTTQMITTPAGVFSCSWFRYTEPVYSGLLKVKRTSYLWLNNQYGVIRQEVDNPSDSTDVKIQVLVSKTF